MTRNDLIARGVPAALRTRYVDGVAQAPECLGFTVTKRDRFSRINGKIVPHGLAKLAMRSGLATFQAGR
jgi:hypothetical protein